ncbi:MULTISPECIES: S1C family serine protease [Aeribacillus]|uniref:Serine protease n=1 Tax=Aeribacillus pallidus TaxID=33936 RepID=A0A165Y0I0_9BACI|nr:MULTISPECIES: S1C family serine protease [Aeribacillus]KZM52812.1 serine protease [Aeribacillus pallidus]KZN96595.1 serine protease [Aeribacillus pallidus]MED0650726.1 S1C family serine protease [Aeribacillus composti]MED0715259.1 S1C family serine protease [Aeribacillus composti]MED0744907.1 S1C family serine protease [Aeribacillus composti]
MGYYDDDFERYNNRKQRGNRGGSLLAGLIGAVLGALLVIFSLPALAQFNILPYDLNISPEQNEEGETGNVQGPVKTVNVNVNSAVTEAVNKVSDAVVGVVNIQQVSFWDQTQEGEAGTGSGVIYKKEGDKAYIVTNHHVVAGAHQLEVVLNDETRIPAELVGSDQLMDLAVLVVDAKHVKKVAEFGNSDTVKPGEPVLAIGNPLGLQFAGSVTQGIISGTERTIPVDIDENGTVDWQAEVLQTDAAINPGNSGGALVNLDGKVIGINSMKIAESAVEGIGLSIPINIAIPIINDLEKFGEVKRPYMGIGLQSLEDIPSYYWEEALNLPKGVKNGVIVMSVEPMSPAQRAGLREKDVIIELAGKKVENVLQLRKQLYSQKVGSTVEVKFYRNGELKTVKLKLVEQKSF